mmetsp:Transcript_30728/g.49372  ORF Transcript_30728/g.49372 Transcript_30728/m.49372 type:complete len:96 (+) Transcript_30728:676-963(+)
MMSSTSLNISYHISDDIPPMSPRKPRRDFYCLRKGGFLSSMPSTSHDTPRFVEKFATFGLHRQRLYDHRRTIPRTIFLRKAPVVLFANMGQKIAL